MLGLFWAGLAAFFGKYIVKFAVMILAGLGMGIITFTGVSAGVDLAQQQINSSYGQLPALVASMLSILQVPYAISVLMSAITFRASRNFFKRFGFKAQVNQAGS